jgi:hypothetical protein
MSSFPKMLLLSILLPQAAWSQELELPSEGLPAGWKAEPKVEADSPTREQVAAKLGVPITALVFQGVSVRGRTAQLNLIRCPDEKGSTRLEETLAGMRGSGFVSRKGNVVVEYAYGDVVMAKKLRDLLGLSPSGERIWEVRMTLGCVDQVDAAQANEVMNLFLAGGDLPPIRARSRDWRLGTSVRLWTGPRPWFRAEYTFAPAAWKKEESGGLSTFAFQAPPRHCGIPYVEAKAEIRVRNAYRPSGDRPTEDLLASTPRWPTGKVRDLAERLTRGAKTAPEKVDAILAYVYGEIKFDGPVVGSRYGVEQVLLQKFGHCWDKSDVFVTLCRASGIPSRQIAGWLAPAGEGHVWAEVYLNGQGWLPVDPTLPWSGTSEDYVPWFSTSDGEMPIVYLSRPDLRIKE